MNRVSPGQSWSIVLMGPTGGMVRTDITIDRIENGFAIYRNGRGKELKIRLRVLQRGSRGAHLNGSPDRLALPEADPEFQPTYTVHEPKGIARAHSQAKEAYRLQQRCGFTIERLARKFKKSEATINSWLRSAREALKEERQARHG